MVLLATLVAACGGSQSGSPPPDELAAPVLRAAPGESLPQPLQDQPDTTSPPRDAGTPAPVPVHHPEGSVHGFLRLSTAGGQTLAGGSLLQRVIEGGGIESRMFFEFADGSVFDEQVTFTQREVFRLIRYRLVQRGPAFETDLQASLDRSGAYRVIATERDDGERKEYVGSLELPADTYNGMPITVIKNLPIGSMRSVHIVAFTPKPRVVELELTGVVADSTAFGSRRLSTARFTLHPHIGGLTGFLADLLDKMPPDSHAWIVTEEVPAFVRFVGPLYDGPIWQIELIGPDFTP
jgi:hypothetical protein